MSVRQTCKECGRTDKFDFSVPDDLWTSVVPPGLRQSVVCLQCFDWFASERNIEYTWAVHRLYFAGDAGTLVFETIGSAPAGTEL